MLELVKKLEQNNMKAYVAKDKTQALEIVKTLIPNGATVAVGGSMTLNECKVLDYLRNGDFNFLDRYKPDLTPDQIREIYYKSFSADVYLCSSNAITKKGELYNVDGNANRIGAICYGPESVIMIVGKNKIVENIDEAIKRVKTIAAPKNAKRLNCQTYCNEKGVCMGVEGELCDGCNSPQRICANYLVSARQRQKDRIKVILVDEILGY